MNILVVNDDGVFHQGIKILAEELKTYGKVFVVVPHRARSAASHSIVLTRPLSFEKIDDIVEGVTTYQTDGKPVDCVRLATSILDVKFDFVFSGVNNGLNIGTDIIYSGTVAAAREGFIEHINSIALSCDRNFNIVKKEIKNLLKYVFENKIYSTDYTVNINWPTENFNESKGIKFTKQGVKRFKTEYEQNKDGKYVVKEDIITYDKNEDTDVFLASEGYITITYLDVNLNYKK